MDYQLKGTPAKNVATASACTRNIVLLSLPRLAPDSGITDWTKTLAAMKTCRDAMIDVARNYPGPTHRGEADWLVKDIDNLAGIITGKRDLWHSNRAASWTEKLPRQIIA